MDFSSMPHIGYGQLAERLNKEIIAKRIPVHGSLELTFRCNLRCVHCYCNLSAGDRDALTNELTTEEVYHILDQIAEAGCLWLLITGGEPLLRKDFLEIYGYAKKRGFLITLFTNGTSITRRIADHLAEWRPHLVEISLYGATKETYESITRVPGSFDRCNRGIDLLLERELPLGLKTMAMTLNHGEISLIKEYADNLGVRFRFDPALNPRLDGAKTPCHYRLSPEEVVALDRMDEKRAGEWRAFCERAIRPYHSDDLFLCGAGVSTFHIDPYGKMSACEMIRSQSFDLRKGSFEKGWHESLPRFLAVKAEGPYPCGRCELMPLCGQCPGWSHLEHGDLETSVAYLCRIAHLRAEAFHPKTS
ncbi:MAG: radical SAM protein [Desulfobacterales bacterium]|nr:radical SAM protein [Desulfobacterales bacterium]